MIRADTYLGRRDEIDIADAETVRLNADDRRRSRVRAIGEAGTTVGIVVDRSLRSGDVIAGEGRQFVVEVETVDALAIDLGEADPLATLELGHAIGNRHWNLAIWDGVAVVPVEESVDRTRDRIAEAIPASATVAERSVSPAVFENGTAPGHTHDRLGSSDTHNGGDSS